MDLAHEGQTPNTLLTPVPDKSLADIEGIHEKKNIPESFPVDYVPGPKHLAFEAQTPNIFLS